MIKLLLVIFVVLNSSCYAGYIPDFRGFTTSITTLKDFKNSSDFKQCKEITGDFYKGLATRFLCENLSSHIEGMILKFSQIDNNILVDIQVRFTDEKKVRMGSQVVFDAIMGKLSKAPSRPPKSMTKSQVLEFMESDLFKSECATTECAGEWHYHGNVMSMVRTMWYASGKSILELEIVDVDRSKKLDKKASDRQHDSDISKGKKLGI